MTNALGVDIPSLPHLGYLSRKAPVAKEILRWARWEPGTQSQNSILLVGIWWAVCLGFWVWIIYILPLLPILLVARSWSVAAVVVDSKQKKAGNGISVDALNEKQQQTQQQLNDILQVLLPVENVMRSIVDFVQWSNNPAKTRRTFLKLVYVYFFWITAHQLFDTRYILLVLGTVALTWYSPWIVRFREYIQYPLIKSVLAALFIGSLETDEEKKDGIMQQALKFQSKVLKKAETVQKVGNSQFTFVIYENQRLWPFGQWEGRTLPVERAPWSDDANETVPTKTNFALPDAMQVTVIDPARPHMEYKKTWAWKWLDPEWQLNFDGNVDELGWEYGTIVWTMFDRYPKGLMSTRRRRWSRRAELDYRVQAVYKQTNDETTIANNAAKIAQEASQVASPLQSPIAADFVMASENSNSNSGNSPPASPAPTSTASMTSLPRFDTSIMNGRSSMTTSVPPPRSPDHARRGSAVDFVTSPTPVPRPSQSTAISSNSGRTTSPDSFRRRRGNSFAQSNRHTSSMYASSIVSEDWNNSMASLDKRASVQSRDTIGSKKRREAVWKSIVRN